MHVNVSIKYVCWSRALAWIPTGVCRFSIVWYICVCSHTLKSCVEREMERVSFEGAGSKPPSRECHSGMLFSVIICLILNVARALWPCHAKKSFSINHRRINVWARHDKWQSVCVCVCVAVAQDVWRLFWRLLLLLPGRRVPSAKLLSAAPALRV